jgi:uncharacterized SAM-binding protein YcdF (DUF218 family)
VTLVEPPIAASKAPQTSNDARIARRYYRIPRRTAHRALVVLAVCLFLAIVGLGVWLRALGTFLVVPDTTPAHADALVVLGGGDRRATREAQAATLYARGVAPIVLTTGGPIAGEAAPATYAEWSVDRLARRGVPRPAIVATNEGDSTTSDARGVRRLAEARGWRDLVLVTDRWHSRRTELVFQSVFRDSPIRLYSSPAASPHFDPTTWWTDEDAAFAVATEYIKLGAFAFGVAD